MINRNVKKQDIPDWCNAPYAAKLLGTTSQTIRCALKRWSIGTTVKQPSGDVHILSQDDVLELAKRLQGHAGRPGGAK